MAAQLDYVRFPTTYIHHWILRSVSPLFSCWAVLTTWLIGMNVDTFGDNPSMKYYFIAVFPFMAFVLVGWYILKHFLRIQYRVLSYKGIYENFYNEMAGSNPKLWSRHGPREYIAPNGRLSKLKWHLIRRWTAPEKTIKPEEKARNAVDPANDLGNYNRFKRHLIRRWTSQIAKTMDPDKASSLENGEATDDNVPGAHPSLPGTSVNDSKVHVVPATPAPDRVFDADDHSSGPDHPSAEDRSYFPATRYHPSSMPTSANLSSQPQPRRSSSTGRSSGVVVEEEDWQWLSQRGKEGKKWALRGSDPRGRKKEKIGQGDQGEQSDHAEREHPPETRRVAPHGY